MPKNTVFRVYGENAATFLIFQAFALTPNAISEVFLANLKKFRTGSSPKWGAVKNTEIWLFPSFGKRKGFGEPDALVIADDHVFWIEVETEINCQKARSSLQKSLLQLWRFFLFQNALTAGPRCCEGEICIVGWTIDDDRQPKKATVKLAGHQVLGKLVKRLTLAGRRKRDHYVLFTVNRPTGPGSPHSYASALANDSEVLADGVSDHIARLPLDRCWYAYWRGHLEGKFKSHPSFSLDLDEEYVRIKRRARRKRPKLAARVRH